eukprot:3728944-Pyramimonas_sp.AAC.1
MGDCIRGATCKGKRCNYYEWVLSMCHGALPSPSLLGDVQCKQPSRSPTPEDHDGQVKLTRGENSGRWAGHPQLTAYIICARRCARLAVTRKPQHTAQ